MAGVQAYPLVRHARRTGLARAAAASIATPTKPARFSGARVARTNITVTSGTIFASRKMPVRDYLLAIAIFVNGAKGHSALQLSRDLDCQYKSALRVGPQASRSCGERRGR